MKASVTIMADFSPELNPPFRWRSKHQTKNDCYSPTIESVGAAREWLA